MSCDYILEVMRFVWNATNWEVREATCMDYAYSHSTNQNCLD